MAHPTEVALAGRKVRGRSMDFTTVKEQWNEYRLEDGSVVKIRLIPGNIVVTDEKHESGDPVVVVQSNILVQYVPAVEGEPGVQ